MVDPPQSSFLGTGWTFPPTFSRQGSAVVMSSNVENIKECLWVLFSTNIGERIMLATYGTGLSLRVFDSLTQTMANDIASLIQKAILDWEPRIDVLGVAVEEIDPLNGVLAISVDFVVRQTNARSNLVYPFYYGEATLAPPAL